LVTPPDAVAAARCELAAAYIEDLRRIDARQRDARRKLDAAVRASGTSLTHCTASARSWPPP
jgi:hypothetical protein